MAASWRPERRRRTTLAALAVLAAVASVGAPGGPPARPARAAGPTDIARVEEVIGAPRGLLGRTAAQVEQALGPPGWVEQGAVASYRNPAVFVPSRQLAYPGLVVDVLATGALRRVRVSRPGLGLPFGLDVGSTREEVERVLGEAQEAGDAQLMYLAADGYPDTVHFHFRDGRVRAIEWNYGSVE